MLVKVDGAPGYGTFFGRPVPGLAVTVDDRGKLLVIVVGKDKDLIVVPARHVSRFIAPRKHEARYPMRGNPARGIPSDQVYTWSRVIGGVAYDFSRVRWADGGTSVRAWIAGKSTPVHSWESAGV
jgi:hypothetical protein